MESANASAEALRTQIQVTETELLRLKAQLAQVEAGAVPTQKIENLSIAEEGLVTQNGERKWPLLPEEYKRYGRQMIVPSVGIQGIPSSFRSYSF
jgi:adenylyltransferase/sulfurtransferase